MSFLLHQHLCLKKWQSDSKVLFWSVQIFKNLKLKSFWPKKKYWFYLHTFCLSSFGISHDSMHSQMASFSFMVHLSPLSHLTLAHKSCFFKWQVLKLKLFLKFFNFTLSFCFWCWINNLNINIHIILKCHCQSKWHQNEKFQNSFKHFY